MYIYWTWWQSTIYGYEVVNIYQIKCDKIFTQRYVRMMSRVIIEYPILEDGN